jgi:hypothetical protein
MRARKLALTEVTYTSLITELTRLRQLDRILEVVSPASPGSDDSGSDGDNYDLSASASPSFAVSSPLPLQRAQGRNAVFPKSARTLSRFSGSSSSIDSDSGTDDDNSGNDTAVNDDYSMEDKGDGANSDNGETTRREQARLQAAQTASDRADNMIGRRTTSTSTAVFVDLPITQTTNVKDRKSGTTGEAAADRDFGQQASSASAADLVAADVMAGAAAAAAGAESSGDYADMMEMYREKKDHEGVVAVYETMKRRGVSE